MTDKQKKVLYRIIATALLYAVLLVMEHIVKPVFMEQWYVTLVLFLIPYFVIGWDIMYKAVRNISHGQVFDENFLMLIATIGAFVVGEYSEGVAVMLFYQVGELFQSYAVNRSRQSITQLMDICPEYANLEEDGKVSQVDPDDVEVGSIIVVKLTVASCTPSIFLIASSIFAAQFAQSKSCNLNFFFITFSTFLLFIIIFVLLHVPYPCLKSFAHESHQASKIQICLPVCF